jgi:threonine dehydratase
MSSIEGGQWPIGGDTLAEGIAVKEPGELTSRIIAEGLVDDIDLVAERDLEHAVAMLVGIEKTVVEGAGAAGLAAILADPERFKRAQGRHHAVRRQYRHASARQCAGPRAGPLRPHRAAPDRGAGPPGALAAITAKFHECGVNIIEVNHSRIFTRLPAKDTVIEVECEARDARDRRRGRALEAAGFHVERASLD